MVQSQTRRLIPGYSRAQRRRAILSNIKRTIRTKAEVENSVYVPNDKIGTLTFLAVETVSEIGPKTDLLLSLKHAVTLCELYNRKVIICFKDSEGIKHTIGAVAMTNEKEITFKSGLKLPIRNIYRVEL